jgi:hypothetical protein
MCYRTTEKWKKNWNQFFPPETKRTRTVSTRKKKEKNPYASKPRAKQFVYFMASLSEWRCVIGYFVGHVRFCSEDFGLASLLSDVEPRGADTTLRLTDRKKSTKRPRVQEQLSLHDITWIESLLRYRPLRVTFWRVHGSDSLFYLNKQTNTLQPAKHRTLLYISWNQTYVLDPCLQCHQWWRSESVK